MFPCLKHSCFFAIASAAVVVGLTGISTVVAQNATNQPVAINNQPERTTTLTAGDGGKAVNPKGFKITVTGGDAGINVGNSTQAFQAEVVNEGPISTVNGAGIKVGAGGKVINRGLIKTTGNSAHGIGGDKGTDRYQSVVENDADITTKGAGAHAIYVIDRVQKRFASSSNWKLGGVRVINHGNLRTTGSYSDGIHVGSSRAPDPATGFPGYQVAVENYGNIIAQQNAIKAGRGAWVINWGTLTAEDYGIFISGSSALDAQGNIVSPGYQSVVENYGDITAEDQVAVEVGNGGRVLNWGTIRSRGRNAGIEVKESTSHYQSVVQNYGHVTSERSPAIIMGIGGRVLNWGTLESTGEGGGGIRVRYSDTEHQSVVENFGRIIARGEGSEGISAGAGARVLNHGVIITLGENSRGIQVYAGESAGFQSVVENDGSITVRGDGASHGIRTEAGIRVVNRGSIITTGEANGDNAPHGIFYAGNISSYKTEELINEGSIHVSGQGVNAIHAGANSIVTNRGPLVSRKGKAINFTGGGNRLTLGSQSYIVGNINLGSGTRVVLDRNGGGSSLWQFEGDLTGEAITASGGNGRMASAYDPNTKQLAVFDASVFASDEDALAAASSGVSDLVGGRLDRLAGVVGGTSRQTAAMDGGMLTGHDAAMGVWFSTGGGIQQFDHYGTTPETTQVSWSGVLGVDYTPLDRSYTVGLFTGYVSNDTWGGAPVNAAPNQKRSFERDDSGVVAGVYGRVYHGSWFADAGLSFGYSDFDHRRWTNDATQNDGLSVLWASQDGWWVRPQLRVGHAIPLQGGWTAIPSLSVSYGRQHLSGYKERGTSGAAMAVKSRTVSFISGGGELALERAVGRKGTVRFHGGYDYRDSVGSQITKVRLLGQDRSVTSSSKARHEFSAGIGGGYALSPSLRVEAWGSALFGPDNRGGHGGLDLISHF